MRAMNVGYGRCRLGRIVSFYFTLVLYFIFIWISILRRKKDGDWYIYPWFSAHENLNNVHKNVQKSYHIFKPRLHNVVSAATNAVKNLPFLVPYRLC